jgi:Holliday junction resolvasome RuvABC endonuclease subunit
VKVLGLDPSIAGTGVARTDGSLLTIKTKAEWGDGERLLVLYRHLRLVCAGVDFAVIEDLPANAMSAGITGRAQGVVRLVLTQWDVPYTAVPPATLKKFATGKGNAKKPDMRAAWLAYSGEDNADDNQVDAAFLRLIGLHLKGETVNLPAEQLAAVDKYKQE